MIVFLVVPQNPFFISDAVTEDAFNFYWMMQQSPLKHARSRRPLSVDDVQVAEAFLFRTSLDDVSESCGDSSEVFLPSPLSSSSSFTCNERTGIKSSPDIPVSSKTSTPNTHRWLHSYPEGTLGTITLYVLYECMHVRSVSV